MGKKYSSKLPILFNASFLVAMNEYLSFNLALSCRFSKSSFSKSISITVIFSTESYNMNTFELRDQNYEMKNSKEYNKYFNLEDINQVITNMGKFLK